MTSAYILILAILILGGLIAALGDRIGTKVGKARLRLFDLRPKQTAVVFTIVTGIVISASTLGILFALSKSLRQGVFQLDEILQKRRHVQADLLEVTEEKERVQQELEQAEIQQQEAKQRLLTTEIELKETQIQLQNFSERTEELKNEVTKLLGEKENLITEKKQIEQKSQELQTQIQQKDQELNLKQSEILEKQKILQNQERSLAALEAKIKDRDQKISELDRNISTRDKILQEKEILLSTLENKLDFLQKEVEVLEQYYQTYQDLREGPIAIVKGQVLTITLVNISSEANLDELIDGILSEANRAVMIILGYGNQVQPQRFIQITKGQVQQIKNKLNQEGEYLIRILSAGNYVQGEENVRVFADVANNEKIYSANETIAGITLDQEDLSPEKLQEKLDFLIAIAQFRARRQGVLGKIFIGDGKITSLLNFIQELQESNTNIDEIKAISTNTTYTSGPLKISLIVIADGEEIIKL